MPLLTKTGNKRPSGGASKSKQPAEAKKAKLPPPTKEQKDALLNYMERHTSFANNRLKAKNAAQLKKSMLIRLADYVNSVKGQNRDGKKWYKCWTDMRLYAKNYAATHCSRNLPTGGGGPDMSINSDTSFEGAASGEGAEGYTSNDAHVDRIMKIIGWHCALGINVPDELNSDTENKENEDAETGLNEDDDDDDDDDVTDDTVLALSTNNEVVPGSSSTPAKTAVSTRTSSNDVTSDEVLTLSTNDVVVPVYSSTPAKKAERPVSSSRTSSTSSNSNEGCCCAQLIEKVEKNNELLQKLLDQLSTPVTVVVPQVVSPNITGITNNENIQTEVEVEFSNYMREEDHQQISENVPDHIFDTSDEGGSYLLNPNDPFVPQG